MNEKKLIDWLLQEDILNLKQGLRPQSVEQVEQAEVVSDELTFSSAEPVNEEPPVNSIAAAQQKKAAASSKSQRPLILAAVVVTLGLAGATYWYVQRHAVTTTPSIKVDLAKAPDVVTQAVTSTIQLTTPVTPELTAASALVTSVTNTQTAITATTQVAAPANTASAQPNPSIKPLSSNMPATTATPIAPQVNQVIAPTTKKYMVVAGPLKTSKIPAAVTAQGYSTNITYGTTRQAGREVIALQPVADDLAAKAEAALGEKGYKVKVESDQAGKLLRVGPFIDSKQADDAAITLVLNQIPAKAQDIQVAVKVPYLNAGPFRDEYEADQARAWLTENLGVNTWRVETP